MFKFEGDEKSFDITKYSVYNDESEINFIAGNFVITQIEYKYQAGNEAGRYGDHYALIHVKRK